MAVARIPIMVVGLTLLVTGCSMGSKAAIEPIADAEVLSVLRERQGTFSSIDRRLRLVIHDQATLAMLPFTVEPVDFSTEMVLLAAMGPTPGDDYSIRIRRVWRDGSRLRARVEVQFPPVDAPRSGTRASPYHLVVVPRCDLRVRGFEARVSPDAFGSGLSR